MARRPLVVLLIALVVCASAATGFLRFSVDAGQALLVGSSSVAGQANRDFASAFGTDPIVVVLSTGSYSGQDPAAAGNPTAPYLEKNLQRLAALEDDLAHDPRVAEVLGPGSVAHAVLSATTEEVTKTLGDTQTFGEYPYFVAETDLLVSRQKGVTDTTQLRTQFQNDLSNARALLALYVEKAAADAHQARATYTQKQVPGADRIIDGAERAADAAASADPLPPLFAEYLAGPGNTPDQTVARDFFDRLTSAFGDCNSTIAQLLQITPSCQIYLDRVLLDLPNCPTEAQVQAAQPKGQELFCSPKHQWAAVLPPPQELQYGNGSTRLLAREVITVRLTAAAAADRSAVLAIRQKISDELSNGIAADPYTKTFSSAQFQTLRQLGPLDPTQCGSPGQQNSQSCYATYKDRPFDVVIAGAPLLTYGVVDSMSETLLILLPVVLVLMAVLLVATFRARGRLWPLLAAVAAGVATVGLSLLIGIPITPAVLAGIPVLIGLAVDYAVQLVARYDEERRKGGDRAGALAAALGNSGPATLTAALATVAGLGALLLIAGVDAGPFVAVPLVAEFALVLCAGVLLAWLTAVFVALPAAALRDRQRDPIAADAVAERPAPARTLAIAGSWRGALVPAVIVALLGWVLLPRVPVQTQVDQLLASSLPQLQDINTVRDQTGYGNEIDISLHGRVAGPYNQDATPANVVWQCAAAETIRTRTDQVALATSIADFFIAASSPSTGTNASPCTTPAPSSTGPAPSPGASPSPGVPASPGTSPSGSPAPPASAAPATATPAAATPTRYRRGSSPIYLAASSVASQTASPAPSPGPSVSPPAPSGSASPGASASPSAPASPGTSPSPAPSATPAAQVQTGFLCDLRLLPGLSRNLVQPIALPPSNSSSTGTLPCPALDKYLGSPLTPDTSPIDPSAARIVIGVQGTSVADEARLVDGIKANEIAHPPSGITAVPAGIAALAAQAYDTIVSRSLLLNLLPLVVVFLALLALERDLRRAFLPVLPTAIAAGWAPLILLLLGLLPGGVGATLGSFNPLTVVLGALVIALATEFGVVLLRRFDEEMARGAHPDEAAAAALAVTGRAIRVSALTLGAGFAVLAVSALFPHGLPLLGAFGLTVLIDLGLAVVAVFGIMLPVAVAIERSRHVPAPVAPDGGGAAPADPARTAAAADVASTAAAAGEGGTGRSQRRSVSGRRRSPAAPEQTTESPDPDTGTAPPRRPGVSGRRRRGPGPRGGS